MRTLFAPLALSLALGAVPTLSTAQNPATELEIERVSYQNPEDGATLSGTLALPPGEGPFPGVVVASVAGADELATHLVPLGYAVLRPERRGMMAVERMLQATFQDLANDVAAGVSYLRSRPEIDAQLVGLVGQGDDAPATALAAADSPDLAFVVLLSAPGLVGAETFRIEQWRLAEGRGWRREALDGLNEHIDRLAEIIVGEPAPGPRMARLWALMNESVVGLPRSAALPHTDEGLVRFFASPWWRARLSFRPEEVLSQIRSPVLALMGLEDPLMPWEDHLPAVQRALESAPSDDVTICLLPGRTRHSFPPPVVGAIGGWLARRIPSSPQELPDPSERDALAGCLEDLGAVR